MNYIKRLESELETARQTIAAHEATERELRRYLLSPKFYADSTVQTRDVLHRMDSEYHYQMMQRGI